MTNYEKYKTAKERREAFRKVYHDSFYTGIDPFDWLDLEAEEERLLPCPFCGEPTRVVDNEELGAGVECTDCAYASSNYDTFKDAIAAHNKIARLVIDAKKEGK